MIEAKETLVGQISSNQNLSGELLPRGPKGDKGEKGDKGDKGDTGAKGADGKDGAMQYEAGENITIEGNVISATGGGGGGINIAYTLEGTSSNNPLIIDRATFNVGDYILFKDAYNYLKFTETTKGYLTVERGLYQIMNNPENVGGAMAGNKFIMMSLSDCNEKMTAIDIEDIQNLSSVFSLRKAQLDIRYLGNLLISNYSSQQSITTTFNFITLPISNINPTNNNQFTRKGYVDALPTTYSGYDATKTQVLKNINGTLTWVDE